ncbi:MAG: zinc-ribbon domain-containing protein, partial [Deltaproteobacteria bacterium]
MNACRACGAEPPDGARFCPSCGTRLDASSPEATERKVVTTLFCDLVGFTALGERHDPEDIDAALRGFYGLARTIVGRFGGTVEKFIGDAVVGLFGVPSAHEDDAERAVRA